MIRKNAAHRRVLPLRRRGQNPDGSSGVRFEVKPCARAFFFAPLSSAFSPSSLSLSFSFAFLFLLSSLSLSFSLGGGTTRRERGKMSEKEERE
jgi:hypothetical protein